MDSFDYYPFVCCFDPREDYFNDSDDDLPFRYFFEVGETVEIKCWREDSRSESNKPDDLAEMRGKEVEIVQRFEDGEYAVKYNNKIFIVKQKNILNDKTPPKRQEVRPDSGNPDKNIDALFDTIIDNNLNQVSALINITGPNIKMKNTYPLILAVERGHKNIVKFLLEKQADVNMKNRCGDTALHCATHGNKIEICSLLLEHGADVNSLNNRKDTPISLAAFLGYSDVLRLLASREEADLTIRDAINKTALHLAIKTSQIECIKILLSIGGCPMTMNDTQYIPFHLAAMKEDEKILKVFLEMFGESIVNLQEGTKHAAIHYAVLRRIIPCLKVLIEYKADINITNHVLQTPLHLAVIVKNLECVKILVENKADLNLKDKYGNTPLQVGVSSHVTEVMGKFMPSLLDKEHIQAMETLGRGPDTFEDIVLYLAKAGARLDIKNKYGASILEGCMDVSLKKKLLAILDERKKQKVSKVSTSKPIKVAGTKSVAEELKELRQTIKQMRDEETCKMCNERRRSIVFGCGHTACDICANGLAECQVCHYKISWKINMIT